MPNKLIWNNVSCLVVDVAVCSLAHLLRNVYVRPSSLGDNHLSHPRLLNLCLDPLDLGHGYRILGNDGGGCCCGCGDAAQSEEGKKYELSGGIKKCKKNVSSVARMLCSSSSRLARFAHSPAFASFRFDPNLLSLLNETFNLPPIGRVVGRVLSAERN